MPPIRSWIQWWGGNGRGFTALTRQVSSLVSGIAPSAQITSAIASRTTSTRCGPGLGVQGSRVGRIQATGERTSRCFRRSYSGIGAEPGIDFKANHPGAREERDSEIKIIDFSTSQVHEQDVTVAALQRTLREPPRPEWAACRWIYVNGLNRQVMRLLGEHKQLHRLAIEDVMDTNTPTKVDWYDTHCFMELTLQKLVRLQNHHEPLTAKKDNEQLLEDDHGVRRARWRVLAHRKFAISVEQVSIFLTSDNTVITIFEHSGADILKPILDRLNSERTIIRSSNDASMLVQAVIDAIVDMSVPVNKAVDDMFGELEKAVLSRPSITQSKQLYILRSGLTLLMDNMVATGGVVRTLTDHRAMLNMSSPGKMNVGGTQATDAGATSVHISQTAQIYLQDVQDHITALSRSTHNAIRSAENLTSLIFNTIAASQNESVRQLTLVSGFFLPLTFLTGYFGMNFDPMPVVNNHSDTFFWIIAAPVMCVTAALLVGARIIRVQPWRWRKSQHMAQRRKFR